MYTLADMENLRQRTARQTEEAKKFAVQVTQSIGPSCPSQRSLISSPVESGICQVHLRRGRQPGKSSQGRS